MKLTIWIMLLLAACCIFGCDKSDDQQAPPTYSQLPPGGYYVEFDQTTPERSVVTGEANTDTDTVKGTRGVGLMGPTPMEGVVQRKPMTIQGGRSPEVDNGPGGSNVGPGKRGSASIGGSTGWATLSSWVGKWSFWLFLWFAAGVVGFVLKMFPATAGIGTILVGISPFAVIPAIWEWFKRQRAEKAVAAVSKQNVETITGVQSAKDALNSWVDTDSVFAAQTPGDRLLIKEKLRTIINGALKGEQSPETIATVQNIKAANGL